MRKYTTKEQQYTVTFRKVEPEILPIDFEGAHLILTGPLAWFYRLFQSMDCEERAVKELYPWLMEAKRKTTPSPLKASSSSLKQGI